MSAWRRKALADFPDLRNEIQHGEETIYTVFLLLRIRCREAHRKGNNDELRKIYDYAEWCFRQKAKDMWNAAGVAFYEHLGNSPETLRDMHIWVKPDIFDDVEGLLQMMMPAKDFRELKQRFESLKRSGNTIY